MNFKFRGVPNQAYLLILLSTNIKKVANFCLFEKQGNRERLKFYLLASIWMLPATGAGLGQRQEPDSNQVLLQGPARLCQHPLLPGCALVGGWRVSTMHSDVGCGNSRGATVPTPHGLRSTARWGCQWAVFSILSTNTCGAPTADLHYSSL